MASVAQSTAKWAAKELRKLDWQSRHELLRRLEINRPAMAQKILSNMSPDEALRGTNTGIKLREGVVIIVKNKRRSYKQLTLHAFFKRRQ